MTTPYPTKFHVIYSPDSVDVASSVLVSAVISSLDGHCDKDIYNACFLAESDQLLCWLRWGMKGTR